VLLIGALAWLSLLARGAYLSLHQHPASWEDAHRQQTEVVEVPGVRGPIYDRAGRTLASTFENPSIALGPCESRAARERLLLRLMEAGVCTPQRAAELNGAGSEGFTWVNRDWIPSANLSRVMAECPGVRLVPELKRFYPAGAIAPEVIGIVGRDRHGLAGLEWRYDEWLSGRPGRTLQFHTGGGGLENAPPPQVLQPPDPGCGLLLTIDARMQRIVRHRLREGMLRVGAPSGFVILTDPRSGEILAICEEPSFDPLRGGAVPAERLKPHCITDQYEPGSTFKIVPFAAALEAGVISPADSLDCGQGERILGSCRIRDHRAFGTVTASEAFSYSSNIGTGRLAERVGWDRCYRMAQALGFGLATGVDLAGEAPGFLPHPLHSSWSERSLITAAYGQEVACTGLQMAFAFGAIANGGVLMKPVLVKALLDGSGAVVHRFGPQTLRRAMSPETAQTMTTLMREVVVAGTGQAAEIPWFPPAGKTGTAQIFDPRAGCYAKEDHILSFIGFAPHNNPRILCEVCLRCQGDHHASEVAAPIFAAIIGDVAWMLEDAPGSVVNAGGAPEARVAVPDVRGLAPQAARQALQRVGLIPVLEGLGTRVQNLRPQPYRLLERGSIVQLMLGGQVEHETVQVPAVTGLALRRAVSVLAEAGLRVGVTGRGWVAQQTPAPGSEVAPGALCVVHGSPEVSRARRDALRRSELVCQTR
jgi:cell division protein FtsI/penicillin-binding protein 2